MSHFKKRNCVDCNKILFQIGDNWYELKLHVDNKCVADLEKDNIKIEPSELCQVIHFEAIDFETPQQDGIMKHEDNLFQSEYYYGLDEETVKIEVETESALSLVNDQHVIHSEESDVRQHINEPSSKRKNSQKFCVCKICKQSFKNSTAMATHAQQCFYTCDYCGNQVKNRQSFVKHMQKEHKVNATTPNNLSSLKTYSCEICHKSYDSYYSFYYHRGTHKGEAVCNVCQKAFQHESLLQAHMKIHLGNKRETKKFQCEICNKMLHKRSDLVNHIEVVHEGKTYKCTVCNKELGSEQSLQNHIKIIHEKKTMFACDICGKNFANGGNLKTHMNTHAESRPFICSYCGKGFNQNNHLLEHCNTHIGSKPNICKVCNKGFTRLAQLRAHSRVHTGEKPYKCTMEGCERAYAYIIDLKRHRYSVHGIYSKQHVCQICGKIYPENKLLKKHLESHGAMQVRSANT